MPGLVVVLALLTSLDPPTVVEGVAWARVIWSMIPRRVRWALESIIVRYLRRRLED